MNKKEDIQQRILNGIKFFRKFRERSYNSVQFKSYWPKFIDLVEDYILQTNVKETFKH